MRPGGLNHAGADNHVGEETASNLADGWSLPGSADHGADNEVSPGWRGRSRRWRMLRFYSGFLLLVTPGGVGVSDVRWKA